MSDILGLSSLTSCQTLVTICIMVVLFIERVRLVPKLHVSDPSHFVSSEPGSPNFSDGEEGPIRTPAHNRSNHSTTILSSRLSVNVDTQSILVKEAPFRVAPKSALGDLPMLCMIFLVLASLAVAVVCRPELVLSTGRRQVIGDCWHPTSVGGGDHHSSGQTNDSAHSAPNSYYPSASLSGYCPGTASYPFAFTTACDGSTTNNQHGSSAADNADMPTLPDGRAAGATDHDGSEHGQLYPGQFWYRVCGVAFEHKLDFIVQLSTLLVVCIASIVQLFGSQSHPDSPLRDKFE